MCSATDEAWRLLASYLEKYPSQNAQHQFCVINKLLSHGVPLPDWLVNSYKVRRAVLSAGGSAPEPEPRKKAVNLSASFWWLHSSQVVDTAALLRLYLNYDLLEEAVELVLEYVDAVLGKGHQYFGIEVNLLSIL